MDEVMPGGRFARPVRRGATVERDAGTGQLYVHELLAYLEARSFGLAPHYLGMTADGRRETLSYIDGEIGYPPLPEFVRADEALVSVARAIRAMHDAADGFVPSAAGPRYSHDVCSPDRIDCVGHGDLAPWNFVFNGSQVAGIIDWDSAGPSSRAWDLSYAAFQFVPFTPTPDLQTWAGHKNPTEPPGWHCSPPHTETSSSQPSWSTWRSSALSRWPPAWSARSAQATRRSRPTRRETRLGIPPSSRVRHSGPRLAALNTSTSS
jgi:hypothetical protein